MKLSSLLLATFMAVNLMGAKLTVDNYSFTAKTMADEKNPGVNDDPEFKKLTDGLVSREDVKDKAPRIIWRHRDNSRRPVEIRFNFATEIKLDEAIIHISRGKKSYGIKDIKLVGITASEDKIPLGGLTLNHPYELPAGEPQFSAITVKSEDAQPIKSLEVIITATGGFLCLNEVEFFGEALPPRQAESPSANPQMKLVEKSVPGLRMYREKQQFVLENDYAIYAIDPLYCGAVNFAYDKVSKTNLVRYDEPGQGFGPLFADRFWPGGRENRDMYRYLEYQAEIISDTAENKQVRMTGHGKSGIFTNVIIEKLYTLAKDSSVLKVDFTIINGKANMAPLNYGYWMAGGVQCPGQYQRIMPGVNGTEVHPSTGQVVARALSSGWFGAQFGDSGLAIAVPYELLKEVYYWPQNVFHGTMECKLGVYPIQAGENMQFTFAMCPFSGIGVPAKVSPLMAGSFGLDSNYAEAPASNTLKLRMFKPGSYRVKISAGQARNGKVEFRELKTAPLPEMALNAAVEYSLTGLTGTTVVKVEVLEADKTVFAMEGMTIIGKGTGPYTLTPDCPKKPDLPVEGGKTNLNFNSMAYRTEHFNWAKPYAGGKPKVLAVNFRKGGIRDMIELAQRFEMDLTTNFIGGIWRISGPVMSLNPNTCLNELSEKLKQRYDVIMVSGDIWMLLTPAIAEAILAQVEQGAGLILCSPEGHPEALSKFISPAPKKSKLNGKWQSVDSNSITEGIPFSILPPTPATRYTTTGKVLATVGNAPLISTFEYGKGKVYAFSYLIDPPKDQAKNAPGNYQRRSSLLFLPLLTFNDPGLSYKFHEYQMALIGRIVYDAAGKKTNISGSALTAVPGQFKAVLTAAASQKVKASLQIRDKFSRNTDLIEQEIELKSGTNELALTIPAQQSGGLHFADLKISGEKGAEWWGSATFDNPAAAKISSVKFEDRLYRKDETIKPVVKIDGEAKIKVSLLDNYGNEFARAEGANPELSFADCLTPACRLVVELEADGKVIDRSVHRIALFQRPNPRDFHIAHGWPGISMEGTQLFLVPYYISILREFGATCSSGSGSEWEIPAVEKALRDGNLLFGSTSTRGVSIGGKRPFDIKVKAKDKFDLIRVPCLSKPGFKDEVEKSYAGFGPAYKYGVLTVAGPDEANMISEWDGCFSPDCQHALREWLKTQYPSLEALNQSWQTEFKSWDEVIAKTAPEVRNGKSFAAWVDHRRFNDWNRADAIGRIVKGIAKGDPELAYSLSGTSETNPVNAWDWYLLMRHLTAMSSYIGEQTIQQASFTTNRLRMNPWIGYDRDFDTENQRLLYTLMNGATGWSIYAGNFYVNPDYTLPPRAQELIRAIKRYTNGPAQAIGGTRRYSYPIAFHYSPSSIKVGWIINLDEQRKSAVNGYKILTEDASLSYDYVAYGQLETTGMPDKYRIFIMPVSAALSAKETAAVEKFVKNGGIVIADMAAGIYNQHGAPQANDQILNIFGLKKQGEVKAQAVEIKGSAATAAGLTLQGLNLKAKYVEEGIVPVSAQSLATAEYNGKSSPVAFVNKYGKGLAIYLGCSAIGSIGEWQEMRYAKGNQADMALFNTLFKNLCDRAEIKPQVTAPTLNSTSIFVREAANMRIIGLVRNHLQAANFDPQPKKHAVNLEGKWHVYDLLSCEYLEYGDKFEYTFGPTTQNAFVLLQYKAEKLTAQAGKDNRITLKLVAATDKYADHVFRVELKDPSGKVNPAYSQMVYAQGNRGEFKLVLPLNAPAGKWTLTATDVLTGISTNLEL